MKPSKGSYKSINGWLWEKCQLHELVEIVRQRSDLDFAQLFNRVREGYLTNDDLTQIKALANINTATWPDEFVKFHLNNTQQVRKMITQFVNQILKVLVFKAQDSKSDTETNTCTVATPDNINLYQTGNLPAELKLCAGARVMLTDNINVFD